MIPRLYSIFVLLILSVDAGYAESLANHPSPYLQLHAKDPVNWQTWGGEIFKQAQQENKLIYLSIGYFSCHWCHVMQKESYSDAEVGAFLNKNFIAVKVDRELRPELDRRMMQFVEAVRGAAGWPLNVFLTPQGYPVTGFTYLPRDNFLQVVQELDIQWRERFAEIAPVARQYFEQTESAGDQAVLVSLPVQHFDKVVDAFVSQAMSIADELQGGFGDTSKFPSYPQIKALLDLVKIKPDYDPDVTAFLRLTLDSMARYHLMDQVNYGFFRYTTDPDWQTPHYEKMLYDNAQMAVIYLEADRLWPGRSYGKVALNTIEFMNRQLWQPNAAYASSLSAVDEDNREGAAYLWTRQQLESVLSGSEIEVLQRTGLLKPGQHEFQIPALSAQDIDLKTQQAILNKLRQAKRPTMPVDDKRLASWNALALIALLKAEEYQPGALAGHYTEELYRTLRQEFIVKGEVRRFAGQPASAETTLEDHAYLVYALALYAHDRKDPQAADLSARLANQAFETFYQQQRWKLSMNSLIPGDTGYYLIQDDVLESPLTVLLRGILLLPDKYQGLRLKAVELIDRMTRDMLDIPYHYASAIMLRKQFLLQQSKKAGPVDSNTE